MVVLRKSKVKPSEFRLRNGEVGLSLFLTSDQVSPEVIIAAVHAAGKQGDLDVVEIPVKLFGQLRLRLIQTPGGTPDPAVNALHIEAQPRWWRRLISRVRDVPTHDWFNNEITP